MVLNWIWVGFFIIAFVIALVKLVFLGDFEVFPAMMDSTFSSSKTAFEISLGLTGGSPSDGLDLYEHRSEHAGTRQCGYTIGPEGDGAT